MQPGQAQGNELIRELTGLVEAGMDVACFDLSQGVLDQHLDLADYLTEVSKICHTAVVLRLIPAEVSQQWLKGSKQQTHSI